MRYANPSPNVLSVITQWVLNPNLNLGMKAPEGVHEKAGYQLQPA